MIRSAFIILALASSIAAQSRDLTLPDPVLQTQDGRSVHFYRDLVKDRVVAVNFIFTTCTTVCPMMGARFARLQSLLGDRARDVSLVSVSIDPANDTPERLAAWSQRLGARQGWTLVTGPPTEVSRLLQAFGVATSDPGSHSPVVMIGDDRKGTWDRLDGLAEPSKMASKVRALLDERAETSLVATQEPPATNPAAHYFQGIDLVDQNGTTVDLYTLMKGRTIVIDSFFAHCAGSCPVMAGTFAALQRTFADHLGKDLVLVSITVDPENDTPAKLKEYAKQFKAADGWSFLTGSREQVDRALKKLGQSAPTREDHLNVFIIGNERTGLWKKAFGLAKPDDVVKIVEEVLKDGQ